MKDESSDDECQFLEAIVDGKAFVEVPKGSIKLKEEKDVDCFTVDSSDEENAGLCKLEVKDAQGLKIQGG